MDIGFIIFICCMFIFCILFYTCNLFHNNTCFPQRIEKVKVKSLSRVQLFGTPWTIAYQASPSMGFSRQEYWSGLPFPSPGDLPDPGIQPGFPALQADALTSEPRDGILKCLLSRDCWAGWQSLHSCISNRSISTWFNLLSRLRGLTSGCVCVKL